VRGGGGCFPTSLSRCRGFLRRRFYFGIEESCSSQVEHHFGKSSGEEDLDVAKLRGPLGRASTRRGTVRLICASRRLLGA